MATRERKPCNPGGLGLTYICCHLVSSDLQTFKKITLPSQTMAVADRHITISKKHTVTLTSASTLRCEMFKAIASSFLTILLRSTKNWKALSDSLGTAYLCIHECMQRRCAKIPVLNEIYNSKKSKKRSQKRSK